VQELNEVDWLGNVLDLVQAETELLRPADERQHVQGVRPVEAVARGK
jgi:hypothetical protein